MSSLSDFPPGFAVCKGGAPELRGFLSPGGPAPLAAVQPRDTAQIQTLVKWANQRGQKLVPVSSAEGPRRHGCTVPDSSAVIVDLSAMKRIHHVDGTDAIRNLQRRPRSTGSRRLYLPARRRSSPRAGRVHVIWVLPPRNTRWGSESPTSPVI